MFYTPKHNPALFQVPLQGPETPPSTPAHSLTPPGTRDMPQHVLTCHATAQTCVAHPDLMQHILTWMQRQSDMTSMYPTDKTQIGLKTGPINVTDMDQV